MNSYRDFQKSCDKHNSPETNIRASLTLRFSESSGRWHVIAAAASPPLGGSLSDPFLFIARTPDSPLGAPSPLHPA